MIYSTESRFTSCRFDRRAKAAVCVPVLHFGNRLQAVQRIEPRLDPLQFLMFQRGAASGYNEDSRVPVIVQAELE